MSLVTVTVLRYQPRMRFRAFANMGRVLMQPIRAEGLRFSKLMGSGIDFGLIPDLSTYVHLGVWEDTEHANAFQQTSAYHQLQDGTEQVRTLYLSPLKSHGHWDGINPFPVVSQQPRQDCSLMAVLTRATIRPRALPDFWRHVPQARQRLREQGDKLLFGIGVGEVPLIQQCTISVWRDAAAVDQYAYRQSGHREVVRLTRQRNWYSEELFARFRVLQGAEDMFTA
ncbi:DUF3291 domain-containing protein [Spirosoma montaniterrae]|uniref:Spheroidene monooxygenase n=1 Tax=Spirosoma montaniterrae TaxID=1178516 RepID=A0A1P9X2L3_9BACT|nr:DUF3291 domain-containing protein [Spirosoma montaniterrae]AQG81861.1 spheroidene monooxygenase [Spirosoma montaniterrae]